MKRINLILIFFLSFTTIVFSQYDTISLSDIALENFVLSDLKSEKHSLRAAVFINILENNRDFNIDSFLVKNVYDYNEIYVKEWGNYFTLGQFYLMALNNYGNYLNFDSIHLNNLENMYKYFFKKNNIPLYENYIIRNVFPIQEIYESLKYKFENENKKYIIPLSKYKNEDVLNIIKNELYVKNENLNDVIVSLKYYPSIEYYQQLLTIIKFYSRSKGLFGAVEYNLVETCINLDNSLNSNLFNEIIKSCKSKFKKRVYFEYREDILKPPSRARL